MKYINAALIFFALLNSSAAAQNLREYSRYSLFSDQKAAQTGDAVTILVVESSQATNNAEKSTGRSSDFDLGFSGSVDETALPGADVDLNTSNQFKGSGSTKTSGIVRTKISATVDSVLQNGNIMIRGSRRISINGEEQNVLIKGIVRTSDIMPDNSVYSYNISDAEIIFEGSGLIENSQNPGFLTRFLHWIF
jgi:flagellar L-ring protein precursor FlgH